MMKKITFTLLFGFFTLIGFSQIGLGESFDAGLTLPPGWTGAGYTGSVFLPCSTVSLRVNMNTTTTTASIESPNIVGDSNGSDLTVTFDYKIVDWSAAVDASPPGWGLLNVQYSTNNGGSWTSMGILDDTNHMTSSTCQNMSFVLPAADIPTGSDFKLRLENTYFSGNYYFYIDNVTATQVVVDPPSCANILVPANGATGVAITEDLSWSAATGLPTGYTVSVGTTPGGTDIVDNADAGLSTSFALPDLDYATLYYVTILPYNANGPAVDCDEFTFETGADPNAPVDCDSGIPVNTQYCYVDNDTMSWNFQSSTGAPLVVFFNAGELESCCDDINIFDGTDNTGTLLFSGNNGGDMTGFSEIATSGFMYIEMDSDFSNSCQAGFVPLNFDVSCVDASAVPNCNANLTAPLNGASDVEVATAITWTPASVLVTGYLISIGTTPGGTEIVDNEDVGDVLTYQPANLLPYETTIYVTITPYNGNGNATGCNENSFETQLNPYQCDAVDQCVYTFTLEDTFGDGWNGNTMTLSQDGLEIEVLTLDNGSGPLVLQIPLCDGIPFELFWNTGGNFANEISISVVDTFGDDVFIMPSQSGALQGTELVSGIVNCIPPTCPRPTDVTIGAINMTDVEISWTETGSATTWEVIVQPIGTGYPTGSEPEIIQTTDNPFIYPGLNPATQYEVYVRAVCAVDDLSDWEGPVNFDTTICDAVDQCNFTFILEDSFGDGWNGNTMTVSQNGVPVQVLELDDGSGPLSVDVPLCDGLPFELFWNNGGGFANEVMVSVIDTFGDDVFVMLNGNGALQGTELVSGIVNCTPPTCPKPDDLTILDISTTSVEVSWTPGDMETIWEILVQPIGTGYPTGTEPEIIQTTDNPYTYNGLTPGVEYEIYVRAICEVDDLSDWEGVVTFKTPHLVDCAAGQVINTTYCYDNGDNNFYEIFTYQSSGGFPLNILFNAGDIEDPFDTIRIVEGDGTIIYEGDNGGDLTGLQFTTTGDTLIVMLESDGSGSCTSSGYIPWDFDVWCQTCIPQTVDFDIVNGDCATDPANPVFEVEVDISDMGDATTLEITDNQGSAPQTVTAIGTVILGPYPASTNIIVTVANVDDGNCIVESNPMAFLCPPPPNPCSIAFAGEDTSVDCNTPEAVLTANFHLYGQDTTNYEINAIDTCPSPPVDGATPTSINTDDVWSEVIDLGFEFCFYGGVYDQIIVGSNGVLSFETEFAGTGNGWDLQPFGEGPSTLPNNTNDTVTEGNIFGVGHDIDPSVCGSIDYVILGSAPYRQFVVNYNAVCHFGGQCNSNTSTSQIILHESSNNIDIHVISKPTCTAWNDGLAVIGLQNVDNTQATTPPGRNTGVWDVTTEESWRFSPSGTPNYTLEWVDDNGTVVGTNDVITVSPTQTTTYSFEVTYDLCTGGQSTVSDEVEVEYINLSGLDATFEVTETCDGATMNILGDTGGEFIFNPVPADGASIDATTGEITGGVSGTTYTVQYIVGASGCPAIGTEDVTILPAEDASFTMVPDCTGATATITGNPGGTFAFNPAPTDAATIDAATGEITNGTVGEAYTVEYTTSGPCSESDSQVVTLLPGDDASFTMTASCTGATATITGLAGGTFAFNPIPTDSAVIDSVTGEITNGVTGATYTVEYTTVGGVCSTTESVMITITSLEDASFTYNPTCDGAIATITGDTGGQFIFNPLPGDGASIDAVTGEITNGFPGVTYTVEYTTAGACSDMSSQMVTVLEMDDEVDFTIHPTCEGATIELEPGITDTTGGVFTFNPVPTDGAVIDPVTGEITGGAGSTTYWFDFTTAGECPSVSRGTFTTDTCVIPQVITPNDDGFNDSFNLNGHNVNKLEVYNRNGIKVYSFNGGYTDQFKGISDGGDKLPTGTYFYVIHYQGGDNKTAWLYINREK